MVKRYNDEQQRYTHIVLGANVMGYVQNVWV